MHNSFEYDLTLKFKKRKKHDDLVVKEKTIPERCSNKSSVNLSVGRKYSIKEKCAGKSF